MAQLIGKDVTLGYEGNVVIEHLNFSVQAGDYLYIVGENGSGKSTLMKAILRLKSQEPLPPATDYSRTRSAICPSRRQYSGTFPHRCWKSSVPAA